MIKAETVKSEKGIVEKLEFFLPRIFLTIAILMAMFSPRTEEMRTFSLIFLSILFEALPFMLLGSLVGGFIEEFISRDKVIEMLPAKSYKSVLIAGGIGFFLPVCECAIVPVVRRLLRKGVPFSAAITYLLAGPIVNPIVALSTAVAYFYDWRVVFARLGFGYVAAVVIGLIVNFLVKEGERLAPERNSSARISAATPIAVSGKFSLKPVKSGETHVHDHAACCHQHAHGPDSFHKRLLRAIRHGADDFLEVACFLVVGAFFATAAQTFVDRQAVVSLMSQSWLAVGIMIFLAIALNLCSEADAFVAASFKQLVNMPGQMAFMVLGPMFDIKLFFMYFSVFSRKTAITLAVVTITVVYIMMLAGSSLLPRGSL